MKSWKLGPYLSVSMLKQGVLSQSTCTCTQGVLKSLLRHCKSLLIFPRSYFLWQWSSTEFLSGQLRHPYPKFQKTGTVQSPHTVSTSQRYKSKVQEADLKSKHMITQSTDPKSRGRSWSIHMAEKMGNCLQYLFASCVGLNRHVLM